MITSSPRAPPPPLTLTGATLGTKQIQWQLNHHFICTAAIKIKHFKNKAFAEPELLCI